MSKTKQTKKTAATSGIDYKLSDLMSDHKTKSAVIRFLSSEKHERADIARFMDIRYQHVRNVLTQEVKKTDK